MKGKFYVRHGNRSVRTDTFTLNRAMVSIVVLCVTGIEFSSLIRIFYFTFFMQLPKFFKIDLKIYIIIIFDNDIYVHDFFSEY